MNIAGRQDELHFFLTCESLAKEEEVSGKLVQDEKYIDLMRRTENLLSWPFDRLLRSVTPEG